MKHYNHVLVAVDFIPNDDEEVVNKAVSIVHASQGKLSIIHVIEEMYVYGGPSESNNIIDDVRGEIEETAKRYMVDLGSRINVPPHMQILLKGQTGKLIIETSNRIDADLIVVGSHGRHGFGLFLLGSTSNDVFHGAQCDVLAIRVGKSKKGL